MQADKKINTDCVRNTQSRDSSFFSAINSCSVSSEWKEREGQSDYFSYRSAFFSFDFSGFLIGFSSFLKSIFSSPMSWETVTPKWEEILRRVLILGSRTFPIKILQIDELGAPDSSLNRQMFSLFRVINLFKGSIEKVISFLFNTVFRFGLPAFNCFSTSLKSIFSSPISWETVIPKYREILTNELNLGSIVFPLKILCNKESSIEILDAKEQRLDGYKLNNFFREVGLKKLFLSFPLDIAILFPDNMGYTINNIKDYLCRVGINFATLQTKKAVFANSFLGKNLESLRSLKSSSLIENSSLLFGLGQVLPIKRRRG